MKWTALLLLIGGLSLSGCFNKDEAVPSGWSKAQLDELNQFCFDNITSKMRTLSDRGDNAKREFAKCMGLKLAREFSHSEYQKAWTAYDEYVKKNQVVVRTIEESAALGNLHPIHNRISESSLKCGQELGM